MNSSLCNQIFRVLTGILVLTLGTSVSAAKVACDNQNFSDFYEAVRHNNAGNPNYKRFDKAPNNYSGFKTYCYNNSTTGGCLNYYGNRYKLVATSGLTKEWSAAVCGRVRQSDYNYDFEHRIFLEGQQPFYAGPIIRFQYQRNDGGWTTLVGTNSGNVASWELKDSGIQRYRWKWHSDTPRRYRIVIERPMKYDEFDLIMDW